MEHPGSRRRLCRAEIASRNRFARVAVATLLVIGRQGMQCICTTQDFFILN